MFLFLGVVVYGNIGTFAKFVENVSTLARCLLDRLTGFIRQDFFVSWLLHFSIGMSWVQSCGRSSSECLICHMLNTFFHTTFIYWFHCLKRLEIEIICNFVNWYKMENGQKRCGHFAFATTCFVIIDDLYIQWYPDLRVIWHRSVSRYEPQKGRFVASIYEQNSRYKL